MVIDQPGHEVQLDVRRIEVGARADLIRVKRLDDGVPVVRRVWRQGERVL